VTKKNWITLGYKSFQMILFEEALDMLGRWSLRSRSGRNARCPE
jgi:hypothetical protein